MKAGHLVRLLGVVAIAGGFSLQAMPVGAVIDSDTASCSITGTAAWGSAVTAVPGTHAFTFPLTWSCSALVGDEAGTWNINFIGTSPDESCASGHAVPTATGSIEGRGPTGTTLTMSQSASSFTFDGTINTAAETHHVHAQINVNTPLCPWPANTPFQASGQGTLADANG